MQSGEKLIVSFDDGPTFEVEVKSRDLVGAEALGCDFTSGTAPVRGMYVAVYVALSRMQRKGTLPDGLALPESVEAFLDCADIDRTSSDAEDDGGKD